MSLVPTWRRYSSWRYPLGMIKTVRLQNYRSFGMLQTAPLESITVLVGANNSGKTNFLHFGDVVRGGGAAYRSEFHRPLTPNGQMRIEWDSVLPPTEFDSPPMRATYQFGAKGPSGDTRELVMLGGREVYRSSGTLTGNTSAVRLDEVSYNVSGVGMLAHSVAVGYSGSISSADILRVMMPLRAARHVHLRVDSLRNENQLSPSPAIQPDGQLLAAVIAHWILEYPEKVAQFNEIVQSCLPEMKRIGARCTSAGNVRLLFEQRDGERFDASEVSDGVVVFAGLIAHALDTPRDALVLLEEPERAVHPRRLVELVDLLRTLVSERGTQFIMATHSPALLNVFREEPDAILTFRRSSTGTVVRRLSDMAELAETLERADPGEMLANGVFNEGLPE